MTGVSTGSTTGGSTTGCSTTGGSTTEGPALRIVTPDATPEEVAALVAVLATVGAPVAEARAPRSQWASPARLTARSLPQGPGGWRASGLPR